MKVILAGYNLDSEVIEELKRSSPAREDVTPETLSAAYARISRDPRSADELRALARAEVEKARRSNRNIIFKMGHHSVAEHAVFNFDVIGISRLAVEALEHFRLCSFTEKSQRYQTLTDDFVLPEEVKKAGKQDLFISTIKVQNRLYHKLYQKLRPYVFEKHRELAANPKKHSLLDGWAKEDARYVVSLATQAQAGMTVNARNLELLIRRLSSHKLAELREFNQKIYALAKEIAPSIILFTEPSDFDARTCDELKEEASRMISWSSKKVKKRVRLVDFTPEGDSKLIAALLHTSSSSPYEECLAQARNLGPQGRRRLVSSSLKYMEFYDPAPREFEYPDLTFDLVISAACFAQLKRHRMATLTTQGYDLGLGVTVPPLIGEVGAGEEFLEVIEQTERAYYKLKKSLDLGAEYILTNAHRRRVLLKVNSRELYHISRLREDATAQWDIRQVAQEMSVLARKAMPLTFLLLGGKDLFPEIYQKVYKAPPKFTPPET